MKVHVTELTNRIGGVELSSREVLVFSPLMSKELLEGGKCVLTGRAVVFGDRGWCSSSIGVSCVSGGDQKAKLLTGFEVLSGEQFVGVKTLKMKCNSGSGFLDDVR